MPEEAARATEPAGRDGHPTRVRLRPERRRRLGLRPFLLGVVPLVALLAGGLWWATSGRWVTTENAYVKADIVAVSARVDGRVAAVEVQENQPVAVGEVLFRIDPEPFRIALALAEAKVLAVRHQIEASRAELRQVEAEIEEAQQRVNFFDQQAQRQRELRQSGITSQVALEEMEMELAAARQRVSALREKLSTVLARLGGDPASPTELHPAFRQAEAERDMAALALADATVRAPVAGLVSRMRLQPGEWVEAGVPAFTIVDPGSAWVEANLKETELQHVRQGQAVEVVLDAYPGLVWRGQVDSLSAATGAEFAVIPPQNATGNWVKVVQRLPVRIAIEVDDGLPPLRAGMTARVAIDTEREPQLAQLINQAFATVRGGE
jgi:membrane fusion protein, multidrug efflux system